MTLTDADLDSIEAEANAALETQPPHPGTYVGESALSWASWRDDIERYINWQTVQVAASRTNAPALVAEVRRLREALQRVAMIAGADDWPPALLDEIEAEVRITLAPSAVDRDHAGESG